MMLKKKNPVLRFEHGVFTFMSGKSAQVLKNIFEKMVFRLQFSSSDIII